MAVAIGDSLSPASDYDAAPKTVPIQRPTKQQTLSAPISFSGIGLHSGNMVNLRLVPAPVNHGVRFFRTDLYNGARQILAHANAVSQAQFCTLLSNEEGGQVGTIEHLMAALHALGVSNVLIEIDGPEIPILDGSSTPFVEAILRAGLVTQDAGQTYLKVRRTIDVVEGMKQVRLAPHADPSDTRLLIDFTIDFSATCIGRQSWHLNMCAHSFTEQVSAARTFGFAEQIEGLRRLGLAQGGSLSNAIVIDKGQVQNPDGLRFDQEFVRHKTLDAVGDLFIEGLPLIGAYTGMRAGHDMTNRAMRALMSNPANFELVEI